MADFLPLDGIIKGKDPSTGNKVQLTAVQDTNGEWVLRVVDAAPFAYDEAMDSLKVKRKRSVPAVQSLSENVNVPASGGTKVWTIQPPVGEIWDILNIGLDIPIPSGASSGSHVVEFFYTVNTSALNQVLTIGNAFGAKIVIRANAPMTKNSSLPTSETDFVKAIQSLKCSNANPLIIVYTNLTNAEQTGVLGLRIAKEIEYTY